jgi:hypothetical protein
MQFAGFSSAVKKFLEFLNRRNDWKISTTDTVWSKNNHRGVWTRVDISHGSIHAILFDDLRDKTCQCDNTPSHTSLVVQQFLAEKSIPVITQTQYSPDVAPTDFWLLTTLKMGLKGSRFATMEDIKSNVTAELRKIPNEAFRRCFQQWQDRWSTCVCVCVRARAHTRVLLWWWLD